MSARIEVDLMRLRDNARVMSELVGPDVGLVAVVKSGAYGHGLAETWGSFVDGGARQFAVSSVAEAVELRDAGARLPIMTGLRPCA